jgi:glycosyltransferase involved in cell wall biosynthesis
VSAPLISCIVPVFNGERYLREALYSILAQTYRPLEVLVADDGSTDGTAAVVASYGAQIRYVSQPNAGPAAARNLGLRGARGEFVAFLDADDLWYPEKLTRQMARFAARPELALCVTHARNFWAPELRERAARYSNHRRMAASIPDYSTVTLLAQRTLFDTVGGFDAAFAVGEDTDWFLRAAECAAVMELLPDVLVYRRLHQTNMSWRALPRNSKEREVIVRIIKASLDRRRRQNGGAVLPYQFPPSDW